MIFFARHPGTTITGADYADDQVLFANTISEATISLYSLKQSAQDNINRVLSYQEGPINTLSGDPLKSLTWATKLHLQRKIRIAKVWSALNGLSIIWKSTLPDELKRNFFHATVESVLLYGSTDWTLTKTVQSKLTEHTPVCYELF